MAATAARLNSLLQASRITGRELRDLVVAKWGRAYEIRLHRRGSRMYLQVMWKHLSQQSFHLSEGDYMRQCDAVADCLSEWGQVDL